MAERYASCQRQRARRAWRDTSAGSKGDDLNMKKILRRLLVCACAAAIVFAQSQITVFADAISDKINVRDIVIAMGACTNSNYASQYGLPGTFAPIASYKLMNTAIGKATEHGARFHVGNCLSSDTFYCDDMTATAKWAKMGVLCIEMEAAALYMNAARSGKNALGIFTVSDNIITGEETTAEERQTSFTQMMEIALETAVTL